MSIKNITQLNKMNYAEKYLRRTKQHTNRFYDFSYNQSIIPTWVWYESLLSFYNTGWFPSERNDYDDDDDWSIHLKMLSWCFHDFYFDKKFTYPSLCLDSLDGYTKIVGGGRHRIEAIQMYNNLMDTDHPVDIICHSYPINKEELREIAGRVFKWNEFEIRFLVQHDERDPLMFICDQKTERNSNGLDVIFDKIKANWQETIVIDNCEFYNGLWQEKDHPIVEGLFSGVKPNVFLETNPLKTVTLNKMQRNAIFLCILLKIPVKNQYFSLKFHK